MNNGNVHVVTNRENEAIRGKGKGIANKRQVKEKERGDSHMADNQKARCMRGSEITDKLGRG